MSGSNAFEAETLVVCPKCRTKLPARKIMLLTNPNAIECPVCSSRLQVENKSFNSAIGCIGVGIGVPTYFIVLSWFQTSNSAFLWLLVPLFLVVFSTSLVLVNKYVKVKIAEPTQSLQQTSSNSNYLEK